MKRLITAFVFTGILVSCNSTDKSKNTTQDSSEIETSMDSIAHKDSIQLKPINTDFF